MALSPSPPVCGFIDIGYVTYDFVQAEVFEVGQTYDLNTVSPPAYRLISYRYLEAQYVMLCIFFVRGAKGPEKSPTGAQDVLS
ncbi:hypothetical protein FOYG_17126 [Fusarium oxysporum NRRL 32931]|uniref:Uncharacterized protein n=1 Tax=Fusarium oxysporum NRRL 32931 TaxID=660029 RepID=W9HHQ8_FUSOX|nr:hypothetical protein FOYG_17126 [Fusarium oxysporum NRRL 32931]